MPFASLTRGASKTADACLQKQGIHIDVRGPFANGKVKVQDYNCLCDYVTRVWVSGYGLIVWVRRYMD